MPPPPPTTTATINPSSDNQSIPYPQTSPLASHRPTRPTAVVPPLPKDPIISSPMGSINTVSSMTSSSPSNYQQVSPQKSSNYPKQVSNENFFTHTCDFFSLSSLKFKFHEKPLEERRECFYMCSFSFV